MFSEDTAEAREGAGGSFGERSAQADAAAPPAGQRFPFKSGLEVVPPRAAPRPPSHEVPAARTRTPCRGRRLGRGHAVSARVQRMREDTKSRRQAALPLSRNSPLPRPGVSSWTLTAAGLSAAPSGPWSRTTPESRTASAATAKEGWTLDSARGGTDLDQPSSSFSFFTPAKLVIANQIIHLSLGN